MTLRKSPRSDAPPSDPPVVSVVIPSYNHAPYVVAAVESTRTASVSTEVVVVDDGSSDDSVARLRALDDPRLRLFTQANQGAHAALDRALGLARGEVIFILNSDDRFAPDRIDRLTPLFQDPDVVVAASWLHLIDDDGQAIGTKHGWHDLPPWPRPIAGPGLADLDDPALALLESNWVSTTSNVAFRRSLIAGSTPAPGDGRERDGREHLAPLSFRPLRYCHDWTFLLEACLRGRLAVVDEPLVDYRIHATNTIKEGRAEGEGVMRFEILWLLARHADRLLQQALTEGHDEADLRARLWRSLPRFGAERLLLRLLAIRGSAPSPPAAYDGLLDPAHPFRREAIRTLTSSA